MIIYFVRGMTTDLFSVLGSHRVDQALYMLSRHHRRVILFLLNDAVVVDESDVILRSDDREQTTLELKHNHLPKLAEAGYIEWDQDTGEISQGPRFDEIKPLLELIKNHADELPPNWV